MEISVDGSGKIPEPEIFPDVSTPSVINREQVSLCNGSCMMENQGVTDTGRSMPSIR
jgi:hypothetical protein